MKKLVTGTLLAVALASGSALAQTTPAPATSTPPAATAPSAPTTPATPPAATTAAPVIDPAVETKFKTADKNASGVLEGAETDLYKTNMSKIDGNKDGKVSREEFAAATKAGVIK